MQPSFVDLLFIPTGPYFLLLFGLFQDSFTPVLPHQIINAQPGDELLSQDINRRCYRYNQIYKNRKMKVSGTFFELQIKTSVLELDISVGI